MKMVHGLTVIAAVLCCSCQDDAAGDISSCVIAKAGDRPIRLKATIALTGYHDWPAKIDGCGDRKFLLFPIGENVQPMEAAGQKAFGASSPRPYIFDLKFEGRFSSRNSGVVFIDVLSVDAFEPTLDIDRIAFLNSRRVR